MNDCQGSFAQFCNLSNNVLNENETKVLKKGLHFAPIQQKNKIPKLRNNFEEVCRRMRIK